MGRGRYGATKGSNVKIQKVSILTAWAFLFSSALLVPHRVLAQAPPGPITPPPSASSSDSSAPPPAAKPKPPAEPPRTTIAGLWKFNADDSDDPKQKVRAAEGSGGGDNGNYPGSYPGGYPGGYPGQYPGRYPGGYPGGGYPGSGRRNSGYGGEDISDNPKMQPLIHPTQSIEVALKNPEIDMTDDHFNKLMLYTDGRQVPKQNNDESRVEIAAHWNGTQLVSDEKSPLGGKMSRTFELSQDGKQLYETLRIDNSRRSPLIIRYVYDAAHSDIETGSAPPPTPASAPQEDPNRPVLKRNPDDSGNSPQ